MAVIQLPAKTRTGRAKTGFTLIELSIVLVIIGLIVGGVLVGQSLIAAAAVRATVTQIEKYNTAANTFRGKYGYLPGDIKDPDASSFGLAARGLYAGEGDGNGLIEGVNSNSANANNGHNSSTGETAMFWVDLSKAGLIEGNFSAASPYQLPGSTITSSTNPAISAYLPPAKLGQSNYIYVWSGSPPIAGGPNFFGLSVLTNIPVSGDLISTPGLTVQQALAIDSKIDDGLPQGGNVFAAYQTTGGILWAAGGGNIGANNGYGLATTNATAPSTTTCYDNGNVAGATQRYSVEISNGANVNCALSFKIQAGD